jgi:hypothetical protein
MYKIETGQVFAYEATVGQYRPIVEGRDTSTRVTQKSDDELLLDRSRA